MLADTEVTGYCTEFTQLMGLCEQSLDVSVMNNDLHVGMWMLWVEPQAQFRKAAT